MDLGERRANGSNGSNGASNEHVEVRVTEVGKINCHTKHEFLDKVTNIPLTKGGTIVKSSDENIGDEAAGSNCWPGGNTNAGEAGAMTQLPIEIDGVKHILIVYPGQKVEEVVRNFCYAHPELDHKDKDKDDIADITKRLKEQLEETQSFGPGQ